jgi:exopolysaccharide biosynthesis WecB/TagA/CpsF family protein
LSEAVAWVVHTATETGFAYVVTPNAQHAAMLDNSGEADQPWKIAAHAAIAQADLCLNDSRVLSKLARFFGHSMPTACGSDLTRKIVEHNIAPNLDINLIGGSWREAAWLKRAMPNRTIRHFEPPMGVLNSPQHQLAIAEFVESHDRSITFLAIGAPQSEIVAHLIARRGKASGIALCIGASIEFLSGTKRRAPVWMRHMGLEWLFRLASEPTRLWRRYLIDSPRIFRIALKEQRAARNGQNAVEISEKMANANAVVQSNEEQLVLMDLGDIRRSSRPFMLQRGSYEDMPSEISVN